MSLFGELLQRSTERRTSPLKLTGPLAIFFGLVAVAGFAADQIALALACLFLGIVFAAITAVRLWRQAPRAD